MRIIALASIRIALLPQVMATSSKCVFHQHCPILNAMSTTRTAIIASSTTRRRICRMSNSIYENDPLAFGTRMKSRQMQLCSMVENDTIDNTESKGDPAWELYERLEMTIDKAMNSNRKQANSLRNELEKAQQSEMKLHRANLITSNLYRLTSGITSITVEDWENDGAEYLLELDTKNFSSANEEAEALFTMARKMKRGSIVIHDLMKQNEESRDILIHAKENLNQIYEINCNCNRYELDSTSSSFLEDLMALKQKLKQTEKITKIKWINTNTNTNTNKSQNHNFKKGNVLSSSSSSSFRTFKSPYSGLKILVGRNRRDNEQLSFQVARKTDLWLHARGCPGAHVVIKKSRGDPDITPDCLQFAANLAAFYSEARTERKAVITVAEPKHIQKPRGAPLGAVKLRQELQSIIGNPMEVPEDCKLKREQNGALWGDEGGMRSLGGKGKNRKRTENAMKKNTEKKRADKREKKKRRHKDDVGDDVSKVINNNSGEEWY